MGNHVALLLFALALVSGGGVVSPTDATAATARPGTIPNAAAGISDVVAAILKKDSKNRDKFATDLASMLHKKYPNYTVIAVDVAHKIKGPHIHQHAELHYVIGTSQGYEVYFVKEGKKATFTREGDGGYINWAFVCETSHCKRGKGDHENVLHMF